MPMLESSHRQTPEPADGPPDPPTLDPPTLDPSTLDPSMLALVGALYELSMSFAACAALADRRAHDTYAAAVARIDHLIHDIRRELVRTGTGTGSAGPPPRIAPLVERAMATLRRVVDREMDRTTGPVRDRLTRLRDDVAALIPVEHAVGSAGNPHTPARPVPTTTSYASPR